MSRAAGLSAYIIAITVLVILIPCPGAAVTAEEIVAQHLQARGGEAAWQQVGSFRLRGTVSDPNGDPADTSRVMVFTLELKRPESIRFEFSIRGKTAVQAYDGSSGWAVMPASSEIQPMLADQVRELQAQNDIDGPLLRSRQEGFTVTLVGTEDVDDRSAYHLDVKGPDGAVVQVFVDTVSFLELKRVRQRTLGETAFHEIRMFRDYRKVGDLLMAHAVEVRNDRNDAAQLVSYTSIELDPELADSRFSNPQGSPQETP